MPRLWRWWKMREIKKRTVKKFFPKRPKDANKGSFGRVLVVAGSATMTGAAVLCAKSVLKAGAGLVILALPQSRQASVAAVVPEVITVPLPETDGVIDLRSLNVLDALIKAFNPCLGVIGPGLGASPAAVPFMKQCRLPLVADADALNRLSVSGLDSVFPREQPVVLTPHPGEMARLLKTDIARDKKIREQQVRSLYEKTKAVCLLKGKDTLVYAGEDVWKNPTGGPALAKAGSGDVLCGVLAGLWAQLGMAEGFNVKSAQKAATCAVYLHGLSGDLAAEDLTDYCVLAGDLLDYLPDAVARIVK